MPLIPSMPLPDEDVQATEQVQPTKPTDGPVVDIRAQLYREHRRLPDREAQRQLKERLRYKHIGTLSTHMQEMGNGVRSGRGLWFWFFIGFMLLAYFNRFGLRGF